MNRVKHIFALGIVAALSVMIVGCAKQPKSQVSMRMDE